MEQRSRQSRSLLFEHDPRANASRLSSGKTGTHPSRRRPRAAFPDYALEKSPDQRDIGRTGHQQPNGERQQDTLGKGMEGGSHGRKHPAILAGESRGFFFPQFTSS